MTTLICHQVDPLLGGRYECCLLNWGSTVYTSWPRLPCWGSCEVQRNKSKNWPKWDYHGYPLPWTSGPADYCMGRGLVLMWARASASVLAEGQDSQWCSSRVKKAFPRFVSSWACVDIRVRMSLKCSFLLGTALLCGWGGSWWWGLTHFFFPYSLACCVVDWVLPF